jgi:hypothetical protein
MVTLIEKGPDLDADDDVPEMLFPPYHHQHLRT